MSLRMRCGALGRIMTKKISAATEFELLVQRICKAILEYQGEQYKMIDVKHNIKIPGFSRKYQVDVCWEYELFGAKKVCVVEVKNYKRPIESKVVQALKAELDDIPGHPDGFIITNNEFQQGAIDFANNHGITLVSVNPVLKRAIFCINIPELISGKPEIMINKQLVKQILDGKSIQPPFQLRFSILPDAIIHLPDGNGLLFRSVIEEMVRTIGHIEDGVQYNLRRVFPVGTTIDCVECALLSQIPFDEIHYNPTYKVSKNTMESKFNNDVDYIISYINGKRMKYSAENGIVGTLQ